MPQSLLTGTEQLPLLDLCLHRIHALLGFYCLLHFAYRYGVFFGAGGTGTDMGFNTLTTGKFVSFFLPHLLLQLSGFRFAIPRKRHPEGNRIWPQYRYEALVFFSRCTTLMGIALYRKLTSRAESRGPETKFSVWPSTLVVFLTMLAADYVARTFRKFGEPSRTIRDLNGPPGALYIMSSAQFHANVHCLLLGDRLCVQLAALTVVQTSAFGMSMRRKRLIGQEQGLFLYGLVLLLGMLVILRDLAERELLGLAISVANFAALLRFELGTNKYILWGIVACLLQECTHGESKKLEMDRQAWWCMSAMSTVLLVAGASRRQLLLGSKPCKPSSE
jgi:hypothetical protein